MPKITITSVTFTPAATSSVSVFFKYKKASDATYTDLNSGNAVTVPSTGVLTTPIVIDNLLPAITYIVAAMSACGEVLYEEEIDTPEAECPSVIDIGLTVGN